MHVLENKEVLFSSYLKYGNVYGSIAVIVVTTESVHKYASGSLTQSVNIS